MRSVRVAEAWLRRDAVQIIVPSPLVGAGSSDRRPECVRVRGLLPRALLEPFVPAPTNAAMQQRSWTNDVFCR